MINTISAFFCRIWITGDEIEKKQLDNPSLYVGFKDGFDYGIKTGGAICLAITILLNLLLF